MFSQKPDEARKLRQTLDLGDVAQGARQHRRQVGPGPVLFAAFATGIRESNIRRLGVKSTIGRCSAGKVQLSTIAVSLNPSSAAPLM